MNYIGGITNVFILFFGGASAAELQRQNNINISYRRGQLQWRKYSEFLSEPRRNISAEAQTFFSIFWVVRRRPNYAGGISSTLITDADNYNVGITANSSANLSILQLNYNVIYGSTTLNLRRRKYSGGSTAAEVQRKNYSGGSTAGLKSAKNYSGGSAAEEYSVPGVPPCLRQFRWDSAGQHSCPSRW